MSDWLPKNKRVENQIQIRPLPAALRYVLNLAGSAFMRYAGEQIKVTGYIERRGNDSYHPIGQAVDVRCRYMDPASRTALQIFCEMAAAHVNEMIRLGASRFGDFAGARVDVSLHWEQRGKADWHIHIEVDDGKPAPAGVATILEED